MSRKTKLLFYFFILFFLISGPAFTTALEINYPAVPGAVPPQTFTQSAPLEEHAALYTKYIFNLAVWVVGFIAFAVVVLGGIRYIASSGKPEIIISAKEQVTAGFLGLLIIFGSVILLEIINPRFTFLGPLRLEVVKLKEKIFVPTSPLIRIYTSIDTEIPFGRIIEGRVLQTYISETPSEEQKQGFACDPENQKCVQGGTGEKCEGEQDGFSCKPRMERITELADTALSAADSLKKQNEELSKLPQDCKCQNAEPVCVPGETTFPFFNPDALLALGLTEAAFLEKIGGLAGLEELSNTLGATAELESIVGEQNLAGTLGSIENIEQLSTNPTQAFQSAGEMAGIMDATGLPEHFSGSFEQLASFQNANLSSAGFADSFTNIASPLADLTGSAIQGDIGGIFGGVDAFLADGLDISGGLNGLANGINITGIGNFASGIIANPTDISGILGGLDGWMRTSNISSLSGGLNDIAGGVNITGLGGFTNIAIADPRDIGGITGGLDSWFRNSGIPSLGSGLDGLSGINFAGPNSMAESLEIISRNPSNTDAVLSQVNNISLSANGPNLTGAFGNFNLSSPLSQISGSGGNINTILGAVNNIFAITGGPNLQSMGGINILGSANPIQNIIAAPSNMPNIMTSVNALLGPGALKTGVDLTNIGGKNIAALGNPIQSIIQNPNRVDGILGSVNSMLGSDALNAGIDLTDIGGKNIVGLGEPIQSIMGDPRNIVGDLNAVNTILGPDALKTGVDLTKLGSSGFNLVEFAEPFSGIMQDPASLSNYGTALDGLAESFPNSETLGQALGSFGDIAEVINNPADFQAATAAMESIAEWAGASPEILELLGNIQTLANLAAEAFCQSCDCDVCKENRNDIAKKVQENEQQLGTIREQSQRARKEIKLLNEELGKLERAEKLIKDCPGPQISSLAESFNKEDSFAKVQELKPKDRTFVELFKESISVFDDWFLRKIKFWDAINIAYIRKTGSSGASRSQQQQEVNDFASFNCGVSGTLGDPYPYPSSSENGTPSDSLGNPQPLSCSLEAPVGEIIDRTKRTVLKLAERLEKLIMLNGELSKEVDKLHNLISECSSQSPKCCSVCIEGVPIECLQIQHPCPVDKIKAQFEKIKDVVEGIPEGKAGNSPKSKEGIRDVVEAPLPKSPVNQTAPEKREQIGIKSIIGDLSSPTPTGLVGTILDDLEKEVRRPMTICVSTEDIAQELQLGLFNCLEAKNATTPEGKVVRDCVESEIRNQGVVQPTTLGECVQECYLEQGQANFRKCLQQCLNTKGQERSDERIPAYLHELNFYCCNFK